MTTLKQFSEFWIENIIYKERKIKTYLTYKTLLNKHILTFFKQTQLSDISLLLAISFKNHLLTKKISKKTINEIILLLKNILKVAVKTSKISENPLDDIELFQIPPKKPLFWSKKDIENFLNSGPKYKELYVVALNTGMRIGELLALTKDDIDFERGLISVNKTRFGNKTSTPKNGKIRYVPMNNRVKAALKGIINSIYDASFLWSMSPSHFTTQIFKVQQRNITGLPIINFHSLRSTFASHFMMNGGNIYDLSKILGHANPSLTSRLYAHQSLDHMANMTEIVNF